MSEHVEQQAYHVPQGKTSTRVKIGGYLLIAFGATGLLLGIGKLVDDFGTFDIDYGYAMIDATAGLLAIVAGWLGVHAMVPARLRMPIVLGLFAGIIDLPAYALYGLGSWTGALGILSLVAITPLLVAYRGSSRSG